MARNCSAEERVDSSTITAILLSLLYLRRQFPIIMVMRTVIVKNNKKKGVKGRKRSKKMEGEAGVIDAMRL